MTRLNAYVAETPRAAGACPRCQQPLIDPSGLGWCKACGYCRSLEDSEQKTARTASEPPAQLTRMTATSSAIAQMPAWFWVSLIGVVLITGATVAAGRFLPLTPLDRAVLATVQIVLGIGMMFLGQFIGVLRIAPEDSGLSFFDAVMPFRLYGMVMKRLPAARHTLYLGVWGGAAVISAVVFIGGLDHWLNYLPGKNKNQAGQVQKAK